MITLFSFWGLLTLSAYAQQFESSNLPIIIIDTGPFPIVDEPKIDAWMEVLNNGPGQRNFLTDAPNEYNGHIGIEFRGATSQALFDKKSYGFETRDSLGENLNVPLLGMPKENDWVLHGPYSDKSLIRNALAYKLAESVMEYAPRTRFIELVINDLYQGVYLLTEKIKQDKNRVNISKLDPTDNSGDALTGGYILKLDKEVGATSDGFASRYPPPRSTFQQIYFQYHYPKPDEITPAQETYIQDFIDDFEFLMDSESYADSLTGYSRFIDPETFVDYFIINELCKNVDAYRLSTFMYKDRDGIDPRLKMGPVWDFNLGFGNVDYCLRASPEGWVKDYNSVCPEDNWLIPFWWDQLWKDQNFRIAIHDRWQALRQEELSDESIFSCIDSLVNHLEEAQERNFVRWPVLSQYVWPNWFVGDTYEEEVEYLEQWLSERIAWMEVQMEDITSPLYFQEDYFAPKVFPNPFIDQLEFEYYIRSNYQVRFQIFDVQGRLLAHQVVENNLNGKNNFSFDGSHFSPGIYFYKIWINEEESGSGKIVKGF